jgi:hypothetical protein
MPLNIKTHSIKAGCLVLRTSEIAKLPSVRMSVIGLSVAAQPYGPEIDPGYCTRIIFLEGACTKRG